jgi:UDP-N-acetylglucosamine--N-acetylmuramyl-(pentapeptide) pyrophosphoryl-undecaprenol N-acetylglucosamine transferase
MHKIFFVAGKSGGHIIPALTLAQKISREQPHIALGIFVNDTSLDRSLIKDASYIKQQIPVLLKGKLALIKAFFTSLSVLRKAAPDKVVSMGGLISVPVCLAAWVLRIPIELYELNVEPGRAVKFLAPFATRMFVCFKETLSYFSQAKVIDYPVRFQAEDKLVPQQACELLSLPFHKTTIFVVGGSQGSRSLNACMLGLIHNITALERAGLQVIHQVGNNDIAGLQEAYAKAGIDALVFAYRHDINLCYSAADLVITRAGSGALHELQFFNKRALIIPLETASTDHQVANARAFAALQPAVWRMVREADLATHDAVFYNEVQVLLGR